MESVSLPVLSPSSLMCIVCIVNVTLTIEIAKEEFQGWDVVDYHSFVMGSLCV